MVLATRLRAYKIGFEQEYKFYPKSKWRADFLITSTKILVEVEGGICIAGGGRHTKDKDCIGDMEKYNSAVMMGFTFLRFSTEQVNSGLGVQQIEKIIEEIVLMINKKYIMQIMDWSKYDLPRWLRLYGLWQQSFENGYRSSNLIAVAMKKAKVRISRKQRAKFIAYYLFD